MWIIKPAGRSSVLGIALYGHKSLDLLAHEYTVISWLVVQSTLKVCRIPNLGKTYITV